MEFKKENLGRFYLDGKLQKGTLWGKDDPIHLENLCSKEKVSSCLLKADNVLVRGKNILPETHKMGKSKVFPEDHATWHQKMLDPGSHIVQRWNRIFLLSCLMALFIDPLYFYLPIVAGDGDSSCVDTDFKLQIVVTFICTVADLFYLLQMFIKFRTAYIAPSSRVFGRGQLVMDPKKIAQSYIRSGFFIDLIATLPLPQIVIWFIMPAKRSPQIDYYNNHTLALIVLLQFILRLYLIFSLSSQMIKATGMVMETAWAGAAHNLLLYMLASHVVGAAWYFPSVDRYRSCWNSNCRKENGSFKCILNYLDCDTFDHNDRKIWSNSTMVFKNCDPTNDITYKYGIFEDAVTKSVVSSHFVKKYFYCLWWGLQQLRYVLVFFPCITVINLYNMFIRPEFVN